MMARARVSVLEQHGDIASNGSEALNSCAAVCVLV
jgi:hypothetical protein